MVELLPLKIVKIGGSSGVILPKDYIDDAKKNNCKRVWVAILTHEESPNSEDLLKWIKKG